MKNILFAIIYLFSVLVQAQEQYLFLNPEGHKSQIRDIVVSNDGKYVVTGSFDKTIR